MAAGISNFQTLFQTYFPKNDLPYLVPDNLPFFNMLPKQDGLTGDVVDHPLLYGTTQGWSMSFDAAAAQSGGAPSATRMSVRTSQAFKLLEFFDKDEALSQGEAAYADLFQKTMSGAMQDFYNRTDLQFHVGSGSIGTVSLVTGNVLTLAAGLPLETFIETNMQIQSAASSPSDGTVPTTLSGPVTVTAVDPDARTVTVTDGTPFDVNTQKYVYIRGNGIGFSSSNTNGGFIGLDNWNPYIAPAGGDNFLGVDRTKYATRLSGYRYDGSTRSVEDAIKRLCAKTSQGGARGMSVTLMNPLDLDALDSKMASYNRYSTFSTATYGFDSIVINTAAGRVDAVSDPHMLQGFSRVITPDTWLLRHKYEVPHVVDVQNRTVEQGLNFDGRTARLRMYGQLFCSQPQKNGIVKLPSIAT